MSSIKAYNKRLAKKARVKTQKGSGWLFGTVADVVRIHRPNTKPRTIYVIHWDDGAVERWHNGTVQMSHLHKA